MIAEKLKNYEQSQYPNDYITCHYKEFSIGILRSDYEELKAKGIDWIEDSFNCLKRLTPLNLEN